MPTITDIAVCIRRWDFSETSQTVSMFTREHGILRGIAKGAKREKGSFSGGIDVLTLGQVIAIVKPGRELATLTQWNLMNLYRSVRRDLATNRAALYMADLLHHMLSEGDQHQALFDIVTATLDQFEAGARVDLQLLRFQWALLVETGYQPNVHMIAGRGGREQATLPRVVAFSPSRGGIVEDTGTGDQWRVRSETVQLLQEVGAEGVSEDAPAETVDRANRLLAAYVRTLIGSEPPTLRWMFPDLQAE